MEYNSEVERQLKEFIRTPAVLVDKNDVPYEFRETGSVNRLKRRRYTDNIPLELYFFVLSNNIPKNQLMEFASGIFLNYVDSLAIYN